MSLATVSIVKTGREPEATEVEAAVRRAIELAGGLADIVKTGDLVIVKPNICSDPVDPFGNFIPGANTRPDVCRAISQMVRERGGRPVIAESSAVGSDTEKGYRRMGYDKLREEGFEVVDLKRGQRKVTVRCPKGKIFKDMTTWELVAKADAIICVPLMKTHDNASVSLGLKNLKGLYTDAMKKRAHERQLFQQVADWATVVKPALTVVDGIVGMEGWGPKYGLSVEMDLIMAGKDPVAVDAVASAVMGFDPAEILITALAAEHGLGTMDLAEIEIAGEPIDAVRRRFIRLEEDPRLDVPGLRVLHSEGTCTGCRTTLQASLLEIAATKLVDNLHGAVALTGAGELPADVDPANLVTIGRCIPKQNRVGRAHVQGCPPDCLPVIGALLGDRPEFVEYAKKRLYYSGIGAAFLDLRHNTPERRATND